MSAADEQMRAQVYADAIKAGHDRATATALARAVTSKRAPYKPAAAAPAKATQRTPAAPVKPAPRGTAALQAEMGALAAAWWKTQR